ncbi:aldehyde dehydrogenase family protein [Acuticoccus mangrovi]|uniref:aldehyde dehydrogenase (NAD(+)) n=1 Tax=Acuticoccus mangrovi TaxID=2796142 RepID=A0A934ISM0_9HYPH|nr:aldehyde dehydrogenase family protein [Acuticoccus mangrovi]MBJ3778041.1 aldehyde dehydrogenase family protein [Acuticoccus mangrovi]
MRDARQFYIDGAWVAPRDGQDLEVLNPSTEEPFATISLGGQADTDAAVAAAKAALPGWSRTPKAERAAALKRLLAAYKARIEEMAEAISEEMGAPIALARAAQAAVGAAHLQNAIQTLEAFTFEFPLGEHAPGSQILMEPIGVCALITPWNWPMNQVTLKVAPALAAGCTVVLKPSEIAPLSSYLFAEMVDAAGIPAGVFNLVNGDGAGVGTQLSVHPDVDMVSFTGSTRAGRAITKNAADTIKRVTLELGGKGANIVFADADEAAVTRGVRHCFNNSGQSCNAPTRMLVERSRYEEAVDTAIKVAGGTQVAPAGIDGRQIGPVVSQVQWDKIQGLIQTGIDEGGRLVAGGTGRPDGLNRGYFVRPTVFADVTPDMTIWREEIFGPVLSISPFDNEDDALQLANDTAYGLTNYVQTQDIEKARRAARALRSGMVEINSKPRGPGAPFGGYRQSGNGREGGVWGLEEFLEVKSVGGWG